MAKLKNHPTGTRTRDLWLLKPSAWPSELTLLMPFSPNYGIDSNPSLLQPSQANASQCKPVYGQEEALTHSLLMQPPAHLTHSPIMPSLDDLGIFRVSRQ